LNFAWAALRPQDMRKDCLDCGGKMAIQFSPERWDRIRETYQLWWEGKLGRPLLPVVLTGVEAGRPMPPVPLLSQANCHDFDVSPEAVIDRIDYELSTYCFLGDAFPVVTLTEFGPGILPLFAGAVADNSSGHVWFGPPPGLQGKAIRDIHLEYAPDSRWAARIRDICRAAVRRWGGQVMVCMPDMGGGLDCLVTFLTNETLLYSLYDEPEEVRRLTWELHDLWFRVYDELNRILRAAGNGYCDWTTLYSDDPVYALQCDFSFMIGPKMFDEFVLPELSASCRRLPRSIYHVDGSGQLPHVDSLLRIPELDVVQWVPDPYQEESRLWPDLFRKIYRAGKKIQIIKGGFEDIDAIAEATGDPEGIHRSHMYLPAGAQGQAKAHLARYGL
jgi:5-methyltetrahydrofolate--homocysteine methyltransferase